MQPNAHWQLIKTTLRHCVVVVVAVVVVVVGGGGGGVARNLDHKIERKTHVHQPPFFFTCLTNFEMQILRSARRQPAACCYAFFTGSSFCRSELLVSTA